MAKKPKKTPFEQALAAMRRAKSKMARDKVFVKFGYDIYQQVVSQVEFERWTTRDIGETVIYTHWSDGRRPKDGNPG